MGKYEAKVYGKFDVEDKIRDITTGRNIIKRCTTYLPDCGLRFMNINLYCGVNQHINKLRNSEAALPHCLWELSRSIDGFSDL